MKYKIKRLTMDKLIRKEEIELPSGAIILKATPSITHVNPGDSYTVWDIHYLEPLRS